MTPQVARQVYYAALGQAYIEHHQSWIKPVVQLECEMEAWKAVCEFVETPDTLAALKEFQDLKADKRSHPESVQSAWERYTALCRKEMELKGVRHGEEKQAS